jgi:hypothetical protein
MAEASQDDWVRRVLGVDIDAATGKSAAPRPKLLPIWVQAKEKADIGIGKLQDALREFDDDDLETIREFGLYGASTGEAVGLMAALREADGQGSEAAYDKVVDAVEEFRDFLDGATIVDLMESNPFGVQVPLRSVLGPALKDIARIASRPTT